MAENMNNSVNDEIDNSRENTPSFQSYMDKQSEDSMYLLYRLYGRRGVDNNQKSRKR